MYGISCFRRVDTERGSKQNSIEKVIKDGCVKTLCEGEVLKL